MCSHQLTKIALIKTVFSFTRYQLWMLQKIAEMLSLIEHQKYKRFLGEDSRPSYFPRRSLTCWGNGKEGKIGERETPRKRLGWENLIFFAASNANLRLSPSRRREAPCEGTNSPRLFTPGETKALAKSKVHQISRA